MDYTPAADRYESMAYRRCGRSGLQLPPISLGLWHNFGGVDPFENGRAIVRRAFDRGVTHFDLANNYGPPPGSAEEAMGRLLDLDLRPYRDELVISTQGRLPHVAGALRRVGLAQVPAREPRPEPAADAPRLRRHLLLAPPRPGHAARGDDDGPRPGRPAGQGPLCRDLELLGRSHHRGRRHPAQPRHPLPHPPAPLLDVRPLDREGPHRRPRARGHRLHRLLAARPGPAHATGTSAASRRARGPRRPTASCDPST